MLHFVDNPKNVGQNRTQVVNASKDSSGVDVSEPVNIPPFQGRLILVQSMKQEYVENTISQSEAVEADPHVDNTIYSDEYADYSNYEAEQSYDGETLAQQNTAASLEGINGNTLVDIK